MGHEVNGVQPPRPASGGRTCSTCCPVTGCGEFKFDEGKTWTQTPPIWPNTASEALHVAKTFLAFSVTQSRGVWQVETTDSMEEARADTDKNVAPTRNVARNSGSVKGGCRRPWDIHDVKRIHAEEKAAGSHGT